MTMAQASYRAICRDGLWHNNPALVQLLGLCPLLAASASVITAVGLGLATVLVFILSSFSVSLIRNVVPSAVRLPAFILIIASAVTCIALLMQAFAYELFQRLGIFLPLIVTNCAILGRADHFAARHPVGPAVLDACMMGAGFAGVLILLGGLRELLGTGALFADMALLFGPGAANWHLVVHPGYQPFLLATLPPSAFILTGLMIAGKNLVDDGVNRRLDNSRPRPLQGSRRVRVTGTIS